MNRRWFLQQSASWIGLVSLFLIGCRAKSEGSAFDTIHAPATMRLESGAIAPNGTIPRQYTCDGDNRSPDLRWDSPPDGTQIFILVVDDPDAPGPAFAHWLIYNLPAATRQLPEGIPAQPQLTTGGLQGKNDFNRYGYGGPCPPSGTHRYVFRLYALDMFLNLPPGANKRDVFNAIQKHVLAVGTLTGRYSRS
ncbi:MAG TPA: YbhB/YbcL family Raf kinase inhibitor-like protein [Crinalium sp.]